ncbi:MAG TPA: hypothetical protein VFK88_01320 [Gallionella sp.]|nr:hypothetical protein [Gallionella sp.]
MAIGASAIHANPTIQVTGLSIYTGIVECLFEGLGGGISIETLDFIITEPRINLTSQPVQATCVLSLASLDKDRAVSDGLWAINNASVGTINEDRGPGKAQLQVLVDLAVGGLNELILQVNYSVFVKQ